MNPNRLLALCLKETWEMWWPYLTKNCGGHLTEREIALTKSSFEMGWQARGIHEEKEANDVVPLMWYLADKDLNPVPWGKTVHFQPEPGYGFWSDAANADKIEPEHAPHLWQPLVRKVHYDHPSKP